MAAAMRPPLSALLEYLRSLGPDERESIAVELFQSLEDDREPGYEEAWAAEIKRRIQEIDDGTAVMVEGEEVMRQLRAGVAGVGSVRVSG
ncbi:MAG: addiction module protein [Dehalococcoidia bacterium]